MAGNRQRGAILVVALMFLIAITLLTLSSMRASNIGLYMAQNEESRIAAEQAAQALADAIVANPGSTPVYGLQGTPPARPARRAAIATTSRSTMRYWMRRSLLTTSALASNA